MAPTLKFLFNPDRNSLMDHDDEDEEDALESYMSSITSLGKTVSAAKLRMRLQQLQDEKLRLQKLINVAKPATLPAPLRGYFIFICVFSSLHSAFTHLRGVCTVHISVNSHGRLIAVLIYKMARFSRAAYTPQKAMYLAV